MNNRSEHHMVQKLMDLPGLKFEPYGSTMMGTAKDSGSDIDFILAAENPTEVYIAVRALKRLGFEVAGSRYGSSRYNYNPTESDLTVVQWKSSQQGVANIDILIMSPKKAEKALRAQRLIAQLVADGDENMTPLARLMKGKSYGWPAINALVEAAYRAGREQ